MAHESLSISEETAAEVDSYRLIQALTPDRTFLCSDASANVVVLVRLEEDCLHRGMLHPSIRDRLARVRELPHPRVATLRGVERWNGVACLVWIYLDGENCDDYLNQHPEQFTRLASSLVAAVGALHDIGIVHGNLHGRNIIVRPDGQPWLTQISPYLYTDPNADISSLIDLLRQSGELLALPVTALWSTSEPVSEVKIGGQLLRNRLNQLLQKFDSQHSSLKELSQLLLELEHDEPVDETTPLADKTPSYRRQSLLGAVVITIAAIVIGVCLRWTFSKPIAPSPATFPSLKLEGHP